MTEPTRPRPMTRPHTRRRAVRPFAALALVAALAAGCAVTPPKPPECDGPWTPINPVRTQAPT